MTKILISAGEISGDMHAARLVRAIKAIDPTVEFYGIGGKELEAAGVEIIYDLSPYSTVGLIEPLIHLPQFIDAFRKVIERVRQDPPRLFIPVDFQGFNNLLMKAVRRLAVPTIYYFGPQEWQWGTEDGGRAMIRDTVKILAIFKEEFEFYKRIGGRPVFIGHPLVDIVKSDMSREALCGQYMLDPKQKIISIFPGSRQQEINQTMPLLIQTAAVLQKSMDHLQFVVSIVDPRFEKPIIRALIKYGLEATLVRGRSYDLIRHTHLSLVTSGTITLEHAILGTPHICAYRFSDVSYLIGRMLFGHRFRKMRYFALPNILFKRRVVPEFLQGYANLTALKKAAKSLLIDRARYNQMKSDLAKTGTVLGTSGVVERAAEEMMSYLRKFKPL
ncbi:lipid-A-disaccharide synthase [bacterium]|nr:lipid-A-disaccharide synthase [bacterium]